MKNNAIITRLSGIQTAQTAADARAVSALNIITASRGLTLSDTDARGIAETRQRALRENERIEIGMSAVEKLILVFSMSPAVDPHDWAELVYMLVENFYYIKTELHDDIDDNELIKLLVDEFENNCGGVIGYMPDRIEAILRRLKGMEDADED